MKTFLYHGPTCPICASESKYALWSYIALAALTTIFAAGLMVGAKELGLI